MKRIEDWIERNIKALHKRYYKAYFYIQDKNSNDKGLARRYAQNDA